MQVPCGRCAACKVAHSREWSVRLLHELDEYGGRGLFVTLTYATDKLPENKSISKEELQNFFKRLRMIIYREKGFQYVIFEPGKKPQKKMWTKPIKYFACGEYGEKRDRPHYHAIILNADFGDVDKIKKAWKLGLVHAGTVTSASCKYVGNYIQKKESMKYLTEGREPPFQLQSMGIGKQYALRNAEQIHSQLNITQMGTPVGIPRYYKKILGLGEREFAQKAQERISEANAKVWSLATDDLAAEALVNSELRQKELNVKARLALKKAKKSISDR